GLKRHEWGSNSPDLHSTNHGLCVEAVCTNGHCEAYQNTVFINIGFGQFHLVGGTNANASKCPVCDHYVKPKTCAFNNCKWRWWGIQQPQEGQPPKRLSADWKVADNAYHRFKEDPNGLSRWRNLTKEYVTVFDDLSNELIYKIVRLLPLKYCQSHGLLLRMNSVF
ncbi:unnamed protein product, partial [Rotaria sp. Silwood1]